MKTLLLVISVALILVSCNTVGPSVAQRGSFITAFGGLKDDEGWSVRQTRDGGYILLGTTQSLTLTHGKRDFYLVKTDANGIEQWSKTYGGADDDEGRSVQQTGDGGYIMVGSTKSYGEGSTDVYLVRVNANGDTLWTQPYGGGNADQGNSVKITANGDFVIAGSTGSKGGGASNFWIIRVKDLKDSATILWDKPLGGSSSEYGEDIWERADGSLIVAGYTDGPKINYAILDAAGNGSLTNAGFIGIKAKAFSVQQTRDGGYVLAGYHNDGLTNNINTFYIAKLEQDTVAWEKDFGNAGGSLNEVVDNAIQIQQTTDDGYIVFGYTRAFGQGHADFYLLKLSSTGEQQWAAPFGGDGEDIGHSVQQTSDGGYIMVGTSNSFANGANGNDMMLVKVGPDGKLGE